MQHTSSAKYRPFSPVTMVDRQWPNRVIERAPIWMSTDLRDGNQALFEPMNVDKKMRMFQMLCDIGFKEIEVGFPSASQTEFDFVRGLIEADRIPEGVSIEVLTQAREPLIRRTMESIQGARQAIVHFYAATNDAFRETVFNMDRAEVVKMAVDAVELIKSLAAEMPETRVTLEFSPEHFSSTDLDFAREVCDAVTAAWGATPERKVILNLPATVEVASPNVYADQIEWMHRHLARRDSVILSLHPHNDRGTAVAAAELGLMAGADRVEGCLFGNGERTGNVDLVTLALNMHTQGVEPGLDFGDINAVARTYEFCTQLPIHPRHPYVGDLVFTAFSGSHQDAIKKGFSAQKADEPWSVPYLPIDPTDVGRTYDSIIRINSQSGKGGVAYLLESDHGIVIPRRMQVEFSGVVQRHTEAVGGEVSSTMVRELFGQTYMPQDAGVRYVGYRVWDAAGQLGITLELAVDGQAMRLSGQGNGPVDAAVAALSELGAGWRVLSFEERSTTASATSGSAPACAVV
ncbi:MAG TPA: 2-isopropylmalate synthase, partial [Aquabacterium sp.]|uniref:2-isopropylmalate synthase n=1 Tax=Aquabacterium sp. TaxID=1872578 RepID=UPI002E31EF77